MPLLALIIRDTDKRPEPSIRVALAIVAMLKCAWAGVMEVMPSPVAQVIRAILGAMWVRAPSFAPLARQRRG